MEAAGVLEAFRQLEGGKDGLSGSPVLIIMGASDIKPFRFFNGEGGKKGQPLIVAAVARFGGNPGPGKGKSLAGKGFGAAKAVIVPADRKG